jgi:RNA polymerase-binding protein DksA
MRMKRLTLKKGDATLLHPAGPPASADARSRRSHVARPAKKSTASKGRPKPARAAKTARPAAAKKTAKTLKKATPKVVRAKSPAPKSKPTKRPAAKPPAKPAGRPAPKAAAPKAPAKASAPKSPVPVARPAPVAKPVVPKPVVAAKAPPPKPEPPKKPRKPELTPKEIAAIRANLVEQRNVFMREFSDLEDAAFNVSQSEVSGEVSFDEEYADAGSFTFEREKELSIGNNIRDLLDKVNHAINAIDRGTYGICENCGNPIAKARLLALPYSTLCLNCKQIDERTR